MSEHRLDVNILIVFWSAPALVDFQINTLGAVGSSWRIISTRSSYDPPFLHLKGSALPSDVSKLYEFIAQAKGISHNSANISTKMSDLME